MAISYLIGEDESVLNKFCISENLVKNNFKVLSLLLTDYIWEIKALKKNIEPYKTVYIQKNKN